MLCCLGLAGMAMCGQLKNTPIHLRCFTSRRCVRYPQQGMYLSSNTHGLSLMNASLTARYISSDTMARNLQMRKSGEHTTTQNVSQPHWIDLPNPSPETVGLLSFPYSRSNNERDHNARACGTCLLKLAQKLDCVRRIAYADSRQGLINIGLQSNFSKKPS